MLAQDDIGFHLCLRQLDVQFPGVTRQASNKGLPAIVAGAGGVCFHQVLTHGNVLVVGYWTRQGFVANSYISMEGDARIKS